MQDGQDYDNPLVRKLNGFVRLDAEDCRLLDEIIEKTRLVPARTDLIQEGDEPDHVHLVLEGFACRYKILAEGSRHIMAYLIPGDFCDLHIFILKEMDHSLSALSPCKVVDIPRERILKLMERPKLAQAMWASALVDEATLREWLVNLGGREATERVAHLLCELLYRLRAVGLVDGHSYELPLTQIDLADTLGLSNVHMNRVLQRLRGDGLISFAGSRLVIHDIERLEEFAGFTPNYLHLDQQKLAPRPHA
ncbi:Crp/Fnr family transcriptional regulator [Afifella sp. JA880]|uniref:Crp/Fnr family transcriptional regulator n=1 Tax=Afifella sp. JA880 TaxID=2975280 RepID=UPI0021BAF77A|nr:Crp/Fnr family transcriptional regulator [Afifella sp. JA880]MCT8267779.1 Crp/Fnr family transcriptional regulator [Afifella sp. JA880]